MANILKKALRYIEDRRLFSRHDRVIVALSGGADSVALLRLLVDDGYECVAAHCNFHLRGAESDRDETFVRQLCGQLGVKLRVTDFQTERHAKLKGISIEMAARELRYEWFERVRQEEEAAAVAVAHHKDDSVETVMLNLIRGTGISGLCGIRPVSGKVVRPLLEVSRSEILDYLSSLKQNYVTDSTNLQDDFTRNKIRLNLLPLMREINPSVSDAIAATAQRLADVEAVYRKEMDEALTRVTAEDGSIYVTRLLAETAPQAVLFEALHPMGFNSSQIADICRNLRTDDTGRQFISGSHRLLRDRDRLIIRPREEDGSSLPTLHIETLEADSPIQVPKDKDTAYLDADRLPSPELEIRRWKTGDRFVPFGMKGWKSVRDYLRDRKVNRFDKERQCVVTSGNDIVWLVGERTDNRFRVSDDTRRVVVLTVE